MNNDYFGGLSWKLFFREKPDFARGNEVLVCHIEGTERDDSILYIDNIPFKRGYLWAIDIEGKHFDSLPYNESFVTSYFNNEAIHPLLNSWILSELLKDEMRGGQWDSDIGRYFSNPERDSLYSIRKYILDDYNHAGSKDYHDTLRSVCEQFLCGYRTNWENEQRELITEVEEWRGEEFVKESYRIGELPNDLDYKDNEGNIYPVWIEEKFKPFLKDKYLIRRSGKYVFNNEVCRSVAEFKERYQSYRRDGRIKGRINYETMQEWIYNYRNGEPYADNYFKNG